MGSADVLHRDDARVLAEGHQRQLCRCPERDACGVALHDPPEQLDKVARSLPLRKLGRPRDVANAVVFLASDAAGHITGQVLSVSGGYTMVG